MQTGRHRDTAFNKIVLSKKKTKGTGTKYGLDNYRSEGQTKRQTIGKQAQTRTGGVGNWKTIRSNQTDKTENRNGSEC